MAVTMICIGLPVCRPAYISILEAFGIQPRKPQTTSNMYGSYAGTYGRNYGSKYAENSSGEPDTWSQRRILADANVVSNKDSTYRMNSLSKNGITVTKTVDVTQQAPV